MKILLIVPILFLFIQCKSQTMIPDQSINKTFEFELQNYLGTWYEIARFNHSFEKNLQGVTATYSVRPDGKIKVLNQGYKYGEESKFKKAIGKARNAKAGGSRNFEVSFFLNFYAPYNILELDKDYQYALIGSNSPNYLWILCRTPKMDDETLQMLISNAKARGYNTDNLLMVDQSINESNLP